MKFQLLFYKTCFVIICAISAILATKTLLKYKLLLGVLVVSLTTSCSFFRRNSGANNNGGTNYPVDQRTCYEPVQQSDQNKKNKAGADSLIQRSCYNQDAGYLWDTTIPNNETHPKIVCFSVVQIPKKKDSIIVKDDTSGIFVTPPSCYSAPER